jgi:hypothetical protein
MFPLHDTPKRTVSRKHTAEVADAVEAIVVNAVARAEVSAVTGLEEGSGVASGAAIGVATVVSTGDNFLTILP